MYKVENTEKDDTDAEEQGITDSLIPETPQERLQEAEQPDEIPFVSNDNTEGRSEPDVKEYTIE